MLCIHVVHARKFLNQCSDIESNHCSEGLMYVIHRWNRLNGVVGEEKNLM
jgi:hypothetical protein